MKVLVHWKLILEFLSSVQSVQSLSRVRLFVTPWTAAGQASLSITNSGVHSNSQTVNLGHNNDWTQSIIVLCRFKKKVLKALKIINKTSVPSHFHKQGKTGIVSAGGLEFQTGSMAWFSRSLVVAESIFWLRMSAALYLKLLSSQWLKPEKQNLPNPLKKRREDKSRVKWFAH